MPELLERLLREKQGTGSASQLTKRPRKKKKKRKPTFTEKLKKSLELLSVGGSKRNKKRIEQLLK